MAKQEIHTRGQSPDRYYQNEAPKWVVKFYSILWRVLQALALIAFLAFCFWLRYRFDKWYINWIME